jgi:hypothetical protein
LWTLILPPYSLQKHCASLVLFPGPFSGSSLDSGVFSLQDLYERFLPSACSPQEPAILLTCWVAWVHRNYSDLYDSPRGKNERVSCFLGTLDRVSVYAWARGSRMAAGVKTARPSQSQPLTLKRRTRVRQRGGTREPFARSEGEQGPTSCAVEIQPSPSRAISGQVRGQGTSPPSPVQRAGGLIASKDQ